MNNVTFLKEKRNIDKIKNEQIVKLPRILKLGPKLKEEFKQIGTKTIFILGRNLKNLICRNKLNLLPNNSQ